MYLGTYIENIKSQWNSTGHSTLSETITAKQLEGGTPGEILALVCGQLIKIKKTDTEGYKAAAKEIDALIDYAVSLNYFKKP
jgi:hypothetical protein